LEGSFEHGNEFSGSGISRVAAQVTAFKEGLISMKLGSELVS
jgi:hypothetical protein